MNMTDAEHEEARRKARMTFALIGASVGAFYASALLAGMKTDEARFLAGDVLNRFLDEEFKQAVTSTMKPMKRE